MPTNPGGDLVTGQALGYVSVAAEDAPDGLEQVIAVIGRDLAVRAERAGHELAEVFADVRGRSEQGFYALVTAVRQREDVAAVVVPRLGDLGRVGCLSGADVRTAERYLRARVLAVHADDMPTQVLVVSSSADLARPADLAVLAESTEARRDPAIGKWVADSHLARSTDGEGWAWRWHRWRRQERGQRGVGRSGPVANGSGTGVRPVAGW